MNAPKRLACPTCGREIAWSEAYPWRPFCSERCKLVDLGAWLSEERRIPGDQTDEAGGEAAEDARPPNPAADPPA